MKNVLFLHAIMWLATVQLTANAQSSLPVLYSAKLIDGVDSKFDIYDQTGKKLFDHPVDWTFVTNWNWIVVNDHVTQLQNIYDLQGQSLEIKGIQEIKDASASGNRVGIRKNGKWGFYDKNRKIKINHLYNEISPFYNNMAAVKVGNNIFMIDTNGVKTNIEYNPKDMNYFMGETSDLLTTSLFASENYRIVEENGKKGVVDRRSNPIIPTEYQDIFDFMEKQGLMTVKKDGKRGVLNVDGKEIVPIKYESVLIISKH